jgi:two-component system, NtrC family, response regulator AtoC
MRYDPMSEIYSVQLISSELKLRNSITHFLQFNPQIEIVLLSTDPKEINPQAILIFAESTISNDKNVYLKSLKKYYPSLPIIVLTNSPSSEVLLNLMDIGINKVVLTTEDYLNVLLSIILDYYRVLFGVIQSDSINNVKKSNLLVDNRSNARNEKLGLIGQSKSMKGVVELINKAATSSINVLLTGETGTGKELVAQFIHQRSIRSKEQLVSVNMAAIPADLLESELFGHERGAFTGAVQQRIGKFEQASRGTIFLDEIGEMELSLQAKLLRVIQEREIVRVGGNKTIRIDCRIITATNKSLLHEVRHGSFREDLYYRLYGLTIELPPLRSRGDDVLLLTDFLMKKFCEENNLLQPIISENAINKLRKHSFPGNIRELKACIELAVVLSDGKVIDEDNIRLENHFSVHDLMRKEKTLAEYELEIIRYYLNKCNGNVIRAAEVLGVGKSTIYRMLKENANFFESLETH